MRPCAGDAVLSQQFEHALVVPVEETLRRADHHSGRKPIHEETLQLVLMALGDSLLGGPMAKALGLDRDVARRLAVDPASSRGPSGGRRDVGGR